MCTAAAGIRLSSGGFQANTHPTACIPCRHQRRETLLAVIFMEILLPHAFRVCQAGGLGIENGGVNTQDGSHDHQEQRHHLAGPHPPHPGSTLVHGNKTLMTPFESQKRSFLPLPSHIHDQTACLVSDLVTTTIMAPSTTRTIETTGPTRQAKCTAPSSMQGFSRRSARTAWQISRPGKCTDIPGIDTSGSGREKAA